MTAAVTEAERAFATLCIDLLNQRLDRLERTVSSQLDRVETILKRQDARLEPLAHGDQQRQRVGDGVTVAEWLAQHRSGGAETLNDLVRQGFHDLAPSSLAGRSSVGRLWPSVEPAAGDDTEGRLS